MLLRWDKKTGWYQNFIQSNFPIINFKKSCRTRTKQASLPFTWPGQDSLLAIWGFFSIYFQTWSIDESYLLNNYPSTHRNHWLLSNNSNAIPILRQIFAKEKKPPHAWIRMLSQSGSCLFSLSVTYLYWSSGRVWNFLTLKMGYKIKWNVLNLCDNFLFYNLIKNQPSVKDNFTSTLIKQIAKTQMYSPKLQYRFRFSRHSFSARYTIAYSQRIHSVMGNIEAISTILVLTKSFRNIDELWKTYQQNESSIWHFSRIKLYR